MQVTPLSDASTFDDFSPLYLNAKGRFIVPGDDWDNLGDGEVIKPVALPEFLKSEVNLPKNVTDVFIWAHGWNNTHDSAIGSARRLFNGINEVYAAAKDSYERIGQFKPAFVVVRWPSLGGYTKVRARTKRLTTEGDAEFFLASLLGYLDRQNKRVKIRGRTLVAKDGFYVHCIGHSFGGRFLTAAVTAAGHPHSKTLSLMGKLKPKARKVLSSSSNAAFKFTVDSMLVFQMAAPRKRFGIEFKKMFNKGPLRGPVVLTFSKHDIANCQAHWGAELETAIGCSGAAKPKSELKEIPFRAMATPYEDEDFAKRLINVNANEAFTKGGVDVGGAHSDFYYQESIHLLLSLVDHMRL